VHGRVVDEHVDGSEGAQRRGGKCIGPGLVGDIHCHPDRVVTLCLQFGDHSLAGGPVEIADGHLGSLGRKAVGIDPPKSRRHHP
jgi:hypothetical protein